MDDYYNRPCAASGFISYRAIGKYGYIMIGAKNNEEAWTEALRSTDNIKDLQIWDGDKYISIKEE